LKLDRGNPNLMKAKATRVNTNNVMESFPNTLGDAVSKRRHRATVGYVPMPRDANTALPPSTNLWAQPVYVPPKGEYVRPGAEDFLRYKSRGL
jgi:hypothetical protein